MKRFSLLTLLAGCLIAGNVHANQYTFTGSVTFLRVHDMRWTNVTNDPLGVDWFVLSTFNPGAAGTCASNSVRIKNDLDGQRMYKLILAARMTNTTVTIHLDEANKDAAGFCYLDYVDM